MDHLPRAEELCERLGISRQQLSQMFMSTGDVCALWQISAQRLGQLTGRDGEPESIAVTKGGQIYLTGDIDHYAVTHGRPRPPMGEPVSG